MEEATQEFSEGTTGSEGLTPEIGSTEDVNETAPVESAPEGTTDEGSTGGENTAVAKSADDIEREWKSQYTRKTQEYASEKRLLQAELDNLRTQSQTAQQVLQEILTNPNKLGDYQRHFGVQQQDYSSLDNIQTTDDLKSFLSNFRDEIRQEVLRETQQTTTQQQVAFERKSRWETAATKAHLADPVAKEWHNELVYYIETVPEIKNLYNGANEEAVYAKAVDHLRSKMGPQLQQHEQKALESVKKKKSAATLAPQKSVSTTTGQKAGRSRKDTMAAIERRLNSLGLN